MKECEYLRDLISKCCAVPWKFSKNFLMCRGHHARGDGVNRKNTGTAVTLIYLDTLHSVQLLYFLLALGSLNSMRPST